MPVFALLKNAKAVAGIALVATNLLTGWLLKNAYEANGRLEAQVTTAVDANQANQLVMENLRQRISACAMERAADLERAKRLAQDSEEERQQLLAVINEARGRREVIYATNPDAETWARTVVPAVIADSLRLEPTSRNAN